MSEFKRRDFLKTTVAGLAAGTLLNRKGFAKSNPIPEIAPQQAPLAPLAPLPGAQTGDVLENDPRVQGLRDLMKHLDRLLPSVRQHLSAYLAWEPYTATPDYEARPEPGRTPRIELVRPGG